MQAPMLSNGDWISLNNHYPVMCIASFTESILIKEITNLRGDNVPVVCGENGEGKIV